MTAHELDNDAKRDQHAALGLQPPDWFAFGTVHHHCAAGAFQSSTDTANEESQDGLHITIGCMSNKECYDIHARFYRKGLVIKNDNLDWFVDTAPLLAECPQKFRPFLPKDWADKQARRLLTTPPGVINFPQQWKDNVIEIKPAYTPVSFLPVGNSYGAFGSQCPSMYSSETEPLWKRVAAAWKEIIYKCAEKDIAPDDVEQSLGDMALQEFAPYIITMACRHHRVDPDDLERQSPPDIEKAIVEETLQQQKEKEDTSAPKSNTTGDGKSAAGGAAPVGGIDEDAAWNDWRGIS